MTDIVDGGLTRHDGVPLGADRCAEIRLRLREEAEADNEADGPALRRRINNFISNQHGRTCWLCKKEIALHFGIEANPLHRRLAPDDITAQDEDCKAWWHGDCWKVYQRDKTNKRRRTRYNEEQQLYSDDLPKFAQWSEVKEKKKAIKDANAQRAQQSQQTGTSISPHKRPATDICQK